jgi:hypothetical protein
MLETIAEFARERLGSSRDSEADGFRRRHVLYFYVGLAQIADHGTGGAALGVCPGPLTSA